MVSSSFARELFNALDTSQTSRPLSATVTLLAQDCPEDDRDLEEGMVSAQDLSSKKSALEELNSLFIHDT